MSARKPSWSMVVLTIAYLLVGQAICVTYLSGGLDLQLELSLWVIDAALLWFSVRTFRRSALVVAVRRVRVENPGTRRNRQDLAGSRVGLPKQVDMQCQGLDRIRQGVRVMYPKLHYNQTRSPKG